MPLLVESLKAENGLFDDLTPHIRRMKRSCNELFGIESPDLEETLEDCAGDIGTGIWKIRVLYDQKIRDVQAAVYQPRRYLSAALIDGGDVEYRNKMAGRPVLDTLTARAVESGCDAALIVKNGLITDFSYANAAFYDGRNWWTPDRPLLEGTRRYRLLEAGVLRTASIRPADLASFISVSPINAMLDLGQVSLETENIVGLSDSKDC